MYYKIICKTDPYNASRHGFKNGVKFIDYYRTLAEANDKMLDIAKDCAETYFANWGNAVMYSKQRHDRNNIDACTCEGRRYVSYDVFTYAVEECDWYEVVSNDAVETRFADGEDTKDIFDCVSESDDKAYYKVKLNGKDIWSGDKQTLAELEDIL